MRLPMNTSLATLKPSGIRRINALAAQHPGCIALALGEPDFPTPDVISAEVAACLHSTEKSMESPSQSMV